MFRRKRPLGLLLFLAIVISVILFRHALLRLGVNIAVAQLFPEQALTYEKVLWDKQALVLKGVHIEESDFRIDVEEAIIKGNFSFSPFSFEPHVSLVHPVVAIDTQPNTLSDISEKVSKERFSLSSVLGMKLDVSQGRLICGQEDLYFRIQSGDEESHEAQETLASFLLSYDPLFQEQPLISLDLQREEEKLAAHFCLHETECANIVQLLSCFYPELREGWEHLEGVVQARGKTLFSLPFSFEEIQMDWQMDELAILHPAFQVDVNAQHFQGELRFPVRNHLEESYRPLWQRAIASAVLTEGSFSFDKWGFFAESAELVLDPNVDPFFDLKGAFFHENREYPLALLGKGSLHEDRTFWLELNAQLDRGEEIFVSLCSPEQDAYIVQGDLKNIPCLLFQSMIPWSLSEGLLNGRLKGDMHIVFKDDLLQPSWFKGFVQELPIEMSFQGSLAEIHGKALFTCPYNQLLQLATGEKRGSEHPVKIEASLKRTPKKWETAGALRWEEDEIMTFGMQWKDSLIEQAEGWFKAGSVPAEMIDFLPITGTLRGEGYFNLETVHLSLQGESMGYSDAQVDLKVGVVEDAILNFNRRSHKWQGSIPLQQTVVKEKNSGWVFEKGKGTLYFNDEQLQAEVSEGDLVFNKEMKLKELFCRLNYDLTTGNLALSKGRAQIGNLPSCYPLLLDKFEIINKEIAYDFTLFDQDSEMARIVGQGNRERLDFILAPESHFFGFKPDLFQVTFEKEGSLAELKMEGVIDVEKLEVPLKIMSPFLGFSLPSLDVFKDFRLDSKLVYRDGKLGFSLEDKKKNLSLVGEKQGAVWNIETLSLGNFAFKGNGTLTTEGAEFPAFIIESPQGRGEGRAKCAFDTFQAIGEMSIRANTPYGEIMSAQPFSFQWNPLTPFTVDHAEMILAAQNATLIAHALSYDMTSQTGKVDQIDFAFSPGIFGIQAPLKGKATLLLTSDNFALEGEISPFKSSFYDRPWDLSELQFSLDSKIATVRAKTSYLTKPLFLTLGVDFLADHLALLKIQETPEDEGIKLVLRDRNCESIQGSIPGLQMHFVKKQNALSGSAQCDFAQLSWLLPPEAERFKLGKGFQVTGDLVLTPSSDLDLLFRGKIIGKNFELLGYQFDDLEMRAEIAKNRVKIFDLHLGDQAGELSVKQLKCLHAGAWIFEAPLLQVRDFQPTRMRLLNGKETQQKPFTISHFSLMDLQGEFSDLSTFVGLGTLNFSNKEKKEAHFLDIPLLDIPLEIFKDLGLDPDLLTPTMGELECRLKGDKLYLTQLKNSVSEGGRSQFYLANEEPSYLSLNGDLHIDLKMRQNVVLNLTELLTLQIRGTLEKPKYSLTP